MRTYGAFLIIMIILLVGTSYGAFTQFLAWRDTTEGLESADVELHDMEAKLAKSKKELSESTAHANRINEFAAAWEPYMKPDGLMNVNAALASIVDRNGLKSGNKRSEQSVESVDDFHINVYSYKRGVSSDFASIANFIGDVEEQFPLCRFDKIEIVGKNNGEIVFLEASLLIPDFSQSNVQAPLPSNSGAGRSIYRPKEGSPNVELIFQSNSTKTDDDDEAI